MPKKTSSMNMSAFFGSKREIYEHYINNPRELAQKLEPGHARARQIAATVRQRVRDALNLGIL